MSKVCINFFSFFFLFENLVVVVFLYIRKNKAKHFPAWISSISWSHWFEPTNGFPCNTQPKVPRGQILHQHIRGHAHSYVITNTVVILPYSPSPPHKIKSHNAIRDRGSNALWTFIERRCYLHLWWYFTVCKYFLHCLQCLQCHHRSHCLHFLHLL